MFDCLRLLFTKRAQWVCGGVEEIDVGFQQRSLTGSKVRKEECIRSIANGHAIFGPGETAIRYGGGSASTALWRLAIVRVTRQSPSAYVLVFCGSLFLYPPSCS